nr:hypothetical protein JUJ52_12165 [Virgibacillus sp. AGTR]
MTTTPAAHFPFRGVCPSANFFSKTRSKKWIFRSIIGANTYRRAFERGVKVIGATAHYVTEKLDEGPILAQQAIHLTDGLTLSDYKQYGKSIESDTLLQAIKWHIEDKIFIYRNKALVLK